MELIWAGLPGPGVGGWQCCFPLRCLLRAPALLVFQKLPPPAQLSTMWTPGSEAAAHMGQGWVTGWGERWQAPQKAAVGFAARSLVCCLLLTCKAMNTHAESKRLEMFREVCHGHKGKRVIRGLLFLDHQGKDGSRLVLHHRCAGQEKNALRSASPFLLPLPHLRSVHFCPGNPKAGPRPYSGPTPSSWLMLAGFLAPRFLNGELL